MGRSRRLASDSGQTESLHDRPGVPLESGAGRERMTDPTRVWTDPAERVRLTDEELAAVPDNPAGRIELPDLPLRDD
jgi:mersacidin/lichenicidin family type 2 lantibiotic